METSMGTTVEAREERLYSNRTFAPIFQHPRQRAPSSHRLRSESPSPQYIARNALMPCKQRRSPFIHLKAFVERKYAMSYGHQFSALHESISYTIYWSSPYIKLRQENVAHPSVMNSGTVLHTTLGLFKTLLKRWLKVVLNSIIWRKTSLL